MFTYQITNRSSTYQIDNSAVTYVLADGQAINVASANGIYGGLERHSNVIEVNGSITTTGSTSYAGVYVSGPNNTVNIGGTGSINAAGTGVFMMGDHSTVTNAGTITAGNGSAIYMNAGSYASVTNSGTVNGSVSIQADDIRVTLAQSSVLTDYIRILNGAAGDVSRIVNEGSITHGGSGWTFIGDVGRDTFINRGTMNGAASFDEGNDVFRNFGTMTNILSMDAGNDVVINKGTLHSVDLGAGDDFYDGRSGTLTGEQVYGGAGNDTFILDRADIYVEENLGGGTDTIRSTVTQSLISDFLTAYEIENLTLIGNAKINGTGNGLANVITGNGAANVLSGLGGNDTIRGGAGNDKLYGGDGHDALVGGAGNDTLNGGGGGDSMAGGTGSDVYIIGLPSGAAEPVTTITELAGQGIDLVKSAVSHTLGANVENLTLTGSLGSNGTGNGLANLIIGNGGANSLRGMAGNDKLRGGAGADTLAGGKGSDLLTGGAGADRFVFEAGDGRDTIADFENGIDRIDLRDWSAVTGLNDLRNNHLTASGGDIIITAGSDVLTIKGMSLAQLDATDFIF